ncbi:MAG: FAD-dependent oxidoreductase [bacterium]|nr:FAD-dependent oxidoreductase [bacterium]
MSDVMHRVVIVGASAAGLRCAARLARLCPDWRVTVVETEESFSWGACGLPYVLSGDIAELEILHRTADGTTRDESYFTDVKGIEMLTGRRAVTLDPTARKLTVRAADGTEETLSWDDLVLATGARPRRLPNQSEHPRVRTFHTAADVPPLHKELARGGIGSVIVVGAGFLGCELCEAFAALWGAEVTLLETAPTVLPGLLDPETGAIVAAALRENDVDLRTGVRVERMEPDEDGVTVHLAGGEEIRADAAVVAIGVAPATELAADAGIELGPTGAIAVDERLATSVSGVWAVGDAAEVRHTVTGEAAWVPLGSLANRQGRTLANLLAGREDRFPAVTGASALKVFDLNVAAVGITRAAATARGLAVRSVWIVGHDKADYWPESAEIALQLTWEPATGRVTGLQAVGPGEVAKRVDVAAQLLARGATLADFTQLEHAYSPPYAPAIDPLAVAAMVAQNAEDGVTPVAPAEELDRTAVLDVRLAEESEARPLAGAGVTCLPQGEARTKLDELDDRPWLVVCERGPRAAEVARWMTGRGRTVAYVGGGVRWRDLAGWQSRPDASAD